jgi:hypothetical protein
MVARSLIENEVDPMSDIRRNRINLLNNDSFRTTSALTGIFSVLGKSPTGVTCAERTATEFAEVLHDHVVEHNRIGYGVIGSVSNLFGWPGARG